MQHETVVIGKKSDHSHCSYFYFVTFGEVPPCYTWALNNMFLMFVGTHFVIICSQMYISNIGITSRIETYSVFKILAFKGKYP